MANTTFTGPVTSINGFIGGPNLTQELQGKMIHNKVEVHLGVFQVLL
jgi:hypothetical protein